METYGSINSKTADPVVRDARETPTNFIREIIDEDLRSGKHKTVITRFPPEPNGYLHIGHAKSICLNFGIAQDYQGTCNLRLDDTNPETESEEYVQSIIDAVRWLGFDWNDNLLYSSDYFEQFYDYAVKLIKNGHAYVDSLNEEEIRINRGTVTEPGKPSPYRDRSVSENLDLFERMRKGEFPDGAHVLRAKGDLASSNMKMRDPLLYRIKHATHYHRGDDWCIYPFYDYAHPLEDAIEKVTHSLCTLEFDNNREIYDWVLEHCLEPEELPARPHQYEFARLNLDYTVTSKRKLLQLVTDGYVSGWDDPRLPTLFGIRRRGVTPESIRLFCDRIGVTKTEGRVDPELFEHTIRDDLNYRSPRVMCVINPLKVVITNYPEGQVEWLEAPYWPHDVPREGSRKIPFTRELFIEQDDFMENPTDKFFRLAPGREVRLRYGYFLTCDRVVKDELTGEVLELRCSYDPATRGGDSPDRRRPKATLHWVSATESLRAEVRLYDRLFTVPVPEDEPFDYKDYLNPQSLVTMPHARIEPSVSGDPSDTRYQFERQGYFWRDPVDTTSEQLVFNRIVGLRDTWAKIVQSDKETRTPGAERVRLKESPAIAEPVVTKADHRERLSPDALARLDHLTTVLGINLEEAIVLAEREDLFHFFEEALTVAGKPQAVANWTVHELRREVKQKSIETLAFTGKQLGELVALIESEKITSRIAKDVFVAMLESGGSPEDIVNTRNLVPLTDRAALEPIVVRILDQFPDKKNQYQNGKTGLMGFFVGQIMRETDGKADPALVQEVISSKMEV